MTGDGKHSTHKIVMTWGWFIVVLTALAGFEASTRGDFLMGIQWVNHSLGFVSEWRYRPISQWNYGHSKGNMMEKWIWGVTNLWTNQNSGCLSEKERAFNVQTMDVIWAHLSCKKKVSRPVGSTHPSVNKWQFTLKEGEKRCGWCGFNMSMFMKHVSSLAHKHSNCW